MLLQPNAMCERSAALCDSTLSLAEHKKNVRFFLYNKSSTLNAKTLRSRVKPNTRLARFLETTTYM